MKKNSLTTAMIAGIAGVAGLAEVARTADRFPHEPQTAPGLDPGDVEASDPGEFGAGHDIGPGGRYWRVRADMWRAGFTNLVARLSPLVPPVEFPEGTGDVDAFTVAQQIASKLEAVVEEYRNLCQQSGDLLGAVHDEIAANLAFREKGGALPDEDMPTFCDRLIAERDREKLNAEKWFNEYEAASSELTVALDKCAEHVREIDALRGERDALAAVSNGPRGLDECPITGRPFFMNMDHDELGYVATYGGPFDSYTIPALDDDGQSLRCERYDHDAGNWVEGGEPALDVLTDAGANEWAAIRELAALRARLSESPLRGEGQVTIEAVATVVSEGGELWLDWLLEGGIGAILPGELLCITSAPIPDDGLLALPAETQPAGGDVDCRENFELWAQTQGHDLERVGDRYASTITSLCWIAWQARGFSKAGWRRWKSATSPSPHPAEANTTGAQGGDALDAKRYRWLRDEGHVTDARIDSAIEADRPAVESLRAQIKAMCAALSTTTPARGDKDTSP